MPTTASPKLAPAQVTAAHKAGKLGCTAQPAGGSLEGARFK